jgi:hypothetical protein
VNEYIFVKNKKITSLISIIVIVGLTFIVFNAEASAKAEEMLGRSDILEILRTGGSGKTDFKEVEDFVPIGTQQNIAGDLNEGQSSTLMDIPNTNDKVLKSVDIKMTWIDESDPPGLPKIRNYENEPDEFLIRIVSPNGTSIIEKSSDRSITESRELTEDEMKGSYGVGNFTVEVTLIDAGDWYPAFGPGLITYRDDGNSFEIVLNFVHLEPEK